ncbi:MAG: hypothetical protein DRJ51_04570 [Thermoprotei archaeon]|nr:MAG: hypothetical protein DRJ51_04570 [Thermoprotei archaeon]
MAGDAMNFIVFVSDTFRRDFLRTYGNSWIRTKYIDEFAKKAVVFDRAYAASFPTVPARRDIFTGRYSYVYAGWEPLSLDERVIAEILSQHGYTTMLIADTPHFLKDGYNFQKGFTGWYWVRGQENDNYMTEPLEVEFPCQPDKLRNPYRTVVQYLRNVSERRYESDYFAAQTVTEAIKWLERNYKYRKRRKFFLYIDTFDPHEPWDPPRWYVDMYDPNYEGEEVTYPVYGPVDFLSERELKHTIALYAGEVTMVDRWFGKLMEKVEDMGLMEDTTIIFTTDHGFYFGEHGLIGKSIITSDGKRFAWAPLYEEVARIPLIIYAPEHKMGWRCDELVQLPDLMPTILELAGIEIPDFVNAKSLVGLLEGSVESLREFAVTSPPIIRGAMAGLKTTITTKEWSFLLCGKQEPVEPYEFEFSVDGVRKKIIKEVRVESELYNLSKDPKQTRNVLQGNLDVARELHRKYIEFLKSVGTSPQVMKPWLEFQ